MLKNVVLIFLLSVSPLFSQKKNEKYITYFVSDDKNFDFHKRQHHLTFINEKICVEIIRRGDLIPNSKIYFDYTKQKDTIFIGKRISKETSGLRNKLIDEFENQKIIILSTNEIRLINANRPYFSQKFIRKLRGNKVVFAVNGTIKKVQKRKVFRFLEQYQKENITIKFVKGEEGYKKYGAIGINEIIEIESKSSDFE